MHPAITITVPGFMFRLSSPRPPITRCSAWSRMAHVFTRITSAPSGPSAASYPCAARLPYMSSESLTFIWQP